MNWFYESGGSQQGPISEAELDRLLAEGKITTETLVWREGMAGWMPMKIARPTHSPSDLDYEVTRPGAPVPPSAGPAASLTPGVATPPAEGAAPIPGNGSDFPQPGWIRCSYTGRYFPPSEIVYIEGRPYSAAAKPQVLANLTTGQALPSLEGPPWEDRDRLGFWKALVETVKAVLLRPAQCFASMRREGGLGSPLLFWLLTAAVGLAIGQLYGVMFQGAMLGLTNSSGASGQTQLFKLQTMLGAFSVIVYPVMMFVFLFIQAGLTHLMLMALKAANHPFQTTLRVFAYGFGAAGTLHLIPMCGSLIAGLWGLVSICIGMGPAQKTTAGKGVAAVLLPLLVCCIGIGSVYALIIGAVVASSGAGR